MIHEGNGPDLEFHVNYKFVIHSDRLTMWISPSVEGMLCCRHHNVVTTYAV